MPPPQNRTVFEALKLRRTFAFSHVMASARGPLGDKATSFRVNVKLPPRNDRGGAHVTRFQFKAPPLLMGEILTFTCQGTTTVAQLKALVKGAPRRSSITHSCGEARWPLAGASLLIPRLAAQKRVASRSSGCAPAAAAPARCWLTMPRSPPAASATT